MAIPFEPTALPEPVRAVAKDALERSLYDEALEAIEAYWHQGGERSPELLFATAWMTFEDAITVMVDEVRTRGERALELLAEAREAGLPSERARKLRARIQRAVKRAKEHDAYLDELAANPDRVSGRELTDLAYHLGGRPSAKDKATAATLFERTGERYHRYNAALLWSQAGQYERAEARILELTEQEPDLWLRANDHFVERAWLERLRRAGPEDFAALWPRAVAAAADLGNDEFPTSHPGQEDLLEIAFRFRNREAAQALWKLVKRRRKLSGGARRLLAEVGDWLAIEEGGALRRGTPGGG